MDNIKNILKQKKYNNVINGNNLNIDINVNSNNKYSLNRDEFTPNTKESQLAVEMSTYFNDLSNYAFYFSVVNILGVNGAYQFWKSIKSEIENKQGSQYEIRSPKKYFTWCYKKERQKNG